jgi:hypothetical protein
MDSENFLNLLKDNKNFNEKTLIELKDIINKYPYFQTAIIAYLLNILKISKESTFEKYLHELTLYIPDHKHFFKLCENILTEKSSQKSSKTDINKKYDTIRNEDNTTLTTNTKNHDLKNKTKPLNDENNEPASQNYNLLELDLLSNEITETKELKNKSDDTLDNLIYPVSSVPYIELIDENETPSNGEKIQTNKEEDLIEKFIREQPKIIPKQENETEIKEIKIRDENIEDSEHFITETLAKIYIKQGLYAKAIFIYEKLCLKYPEKNAYFVAQIENIKKLSNK